MNWSILLSHTAALPLKLQNYALCFFFLLWTKERLEGALSQPEKCTTHFWGHFPGKSDVANKASALPPQRSSESIRQVYVGDLKTSDGFLPVLPEGKE